MLENNVASKSHVKLITQIKVNTKINFCENEEGFIVRLRLDFHNLKILLKSLNKDFNVSIDKTD